MEMITQKTNLQANNILQKCSFFDSPRNIESFNHLIPIHLHQEKIPGEIFQSDDD